LNRYLKVSSFVGVKGDFHIFTFSQRVLKKATNRKNVLAVSACICNAQAPLNTPLKLSEQIVVMIANRLPSSLMMPINDLDYANYP